MTSRDESAAIPIALEAPSVPRPGRRLDARDLALKLAALMVLALVWQGASFLAPPNFLPGPLVVLGRVLELIATGEFFGQAVPTVLRVSVGFAIALALGTAVGIAMGSRRELESFLETYILIGLTIPGLAWAVLALMWFGITEIAPVFSIAVVTLPMLAVNMWQGTKAIDRELLEMQRAFRAPRSALLRDVIVPQLLPYLFAGGRFGFGLGWKVVVLSEMFGLSSGIGYQINRAFSLYSMREVLAWTLGFTLVMAAFEYGVLRRLEAHYLRWRPALRV